MKTLIAFTICLSSVVADDPIRIRVATFNINWANSNLPAIAKTIRDSAADVVFLQETNAASERFLGQQFSKDYPHAHFVGHHGKYAAERFGLISKFPIRNPRFEPPQHGLFGTLYADLRFTDQQIRIVNVHLSPFGVRKGNTLAQSMAAVGATEGIHKKEIETIVQSIDVNTPTLVAGDFNSMSTFVAPTTLVKQGLADSFASVNESPDTQPTWHWPLRVGQLQFRIDYIFHTPNFQTTSSKILQSKGSDHYLMVSEFLVPGSP